MGWGQNEGGGDFKEKYFPEMRNQVEIVTGRSDKDHQMIEREKEGEREGEGRGGGERERSG